MADVDVDRLGVKSLALTVNNGGGVSGLVAFVALRRAETPDSYLDFSDLTFKTSGFVTKEATMTEVGGGHYAYTLDLATIAASLPAATEELIAEYRTSGSLVGVSNDIIRLLQNTSIAVGSPFHPQGVLP